MDVSEGHGGDDDHQDHHKDRNVGRLGVKNEEESEKKSSDEVPQLPDQMSGNNDRVEGNSDAEFIVNQMDRRGSLEVVGGQFGNELGQSSANRDMLNQRERTPSQNMENIVSLSHGQMTNTRNVSGLSTGQTRPVFPLEGTMLYHRNVLSQGQGTGGTRPWLHPEGSNQGKVSYSRNVSGQGQQGMHSQSVNPTATHYQCGTSFFMPVKPRIEEQPSAGTGFFMPRGVHEHNMRTWSYPNRVNGNMLRQRGPSVPWGCHSHTHSHVQRGRSRACRTQRPPFVNSGMFVPRAVHEHNMRVRPGPNVVSGNMIRQGTPMVQTGRHRGIFGAPMSPFIPNFGPQNIGPPAVAPSVNMPRSNMGMLPNANMAVEHRGTMGEASHREEGTSRRYRREHDREHDHEQGSSSGDAKRTTR